MRGVMVTLTLVTAMVGTSAAQTPLSRLTLEEAVARAIDAHPSVRAKELERLATRAQEVTAALRPNPTGSFSAEQFGGRSTEPQYTVALEQTIETGGKRERRIDAARAATRVVGFEVEDARRQIAVQVKKVFTDAVLAQALLTFANQNLRVLDELEGLQRLRAERGDISQLELTRLQVQRYASERDLTEAARSLQAARVSLRSLVGPEMLAEDFLVVGDLVFRDVTLERPQLVRQALDRRPDLRAADAARQRAQADAALARANAWWDFAPQIQYQRVGTDNTIGFGVSIPLRFFDRNQGERERTAAEVRRADVLRQAALIQVETDIDTSLAQVSAERDKVVLLRDVYVPRAQRVRDIVEYAYRRGGVSLLDFLDAERTYRETVVEQLRTLAAYSNALSDLEAAVGAGL